MISAHGAGDWDAFVSYAAYACDARVWGAASNELVALSDEGTSLVVHLLPHERGELADVSRVVAMADWKKIRRKVLRAPPPSALTAPCRDEPRLPPPVETVRQVCARGATTRAGR